MMMVLMIELMRTVILDFGTNAYEDPDTDRGGDDDGAEL